MHYPHSTHRLMYIINPHPIQTHPRVSVSLEKPKIEKEFSQVVYENDTLALATRINFDKTAIVGFACTRFKASNQPYPDIV